MTISHNLSIYSQYDYTVYKTFDMKFDKCIHPQRQQFQNNTK